MRENWMYIPSILICISSTFNGNMDAESRVSILLGDPRKAIVTMVIPIVLSL